MRAYVVQVFQGGTGKYLETESGVMPFHELDKLLGQYRAPMAQLNRPGKPGSYTAEDGTYIRWAPISGPI